MTEKNVHDDELLQRLLKDLDKSIEVPDNNESWNRMKIKLAEHRKKRNRILRIRIVVAFVCVFIVCSIFISSNNPHAYASFTSLFKKIQNHVIEIFLNKPKEDQGKALTLPPPSDGSMNEQINNSSVPEKVTLEEAKKKLPSSIKLLKAPPANYTLKEIRIFRDSDNQYRTVYMEYTGPNDELFRIEEHMITENSGIKTQIPENYGEIKDVDINGSPGILMILPDGMVKLQWIASNVKFYISGYLSDTETLEWAKTLK